MTVRPQRRRQTCLVVPGNGPSKLAKARGIEVHEIVLDLEDAVALADKAAARRHMVDAVRETGFRAATLAVRVNPLDSGLLLDDLEAIYEAGGVDCIVLPKAESARDVQVVAGLLEQFERRSGHPAVGIEAQIESVAGLAAAESIAASPRLEALLFGPLDFVADFGGTPDTFLGPPPGTRDVYAEVLFRIVLAARAHGVQAIDGPYARLSDDAGLRAATRRALGLGADGKWIIHPKHVAPVRDTMRPTPDELDAARGVLESLGFDDTGSLTVGVASIDGEMADAASARIALKTLERAEALAGSGAPSTTHERRSL